MRRIAGGVIFSLAVIIFLAAAGLAVASGIRPDPDPKQSLKAGLNRPALPTLSTDEIVVVEIVDELQLPTSNAHPPSASPQVSTGSHYPPRCDSCHDFSQSCSTCHHDVQDSGHYSAECSACHIPPVIPNPGFTAWKLVRVDHTRSTMTDCRDCHLDDSPPDHFQAQCSACHAAPKQDGNTWLPVTVNHAAESGLDCQACHEPDRPQNHYGGQCSSCHLSPVESATGWLPASFDHKAAGAVDCKSCHASNRPANHFTGQCSTCHTTARWQGARFNHQGVSNCQNCHNAPRNHWGNECQRCHRIVADGNASWGRLNLRWHPFDMDHGDAGGSCSTCHTSRGVDCTSCHESEDHDDGDDD